MRSFWRCIALSVAASLTSGCIIFIPLEGSDGGLPAADGGTGVLTQPHLDGGRRPSSWRDGVAPIVNDVPGWYVANERDRVLYPVGELHSPIPSSIATRLRTIALHGEQLQDNVFMKVGDSITASASFMRCFDGDVNGLAPTWEFNIGLGGRTQLADAIFHFRSGDVDGTTPFARSSRSAQVGAVAYWATEGTPSPLQVEFDATRPQFATVMYGTNDVNQGGSAVAPLDQKLNPYARDLLLVVDRLLEKGVVPVVSTIPPRTQPPEYLTLTPVMNAVARAVAQGRQVPLVDFHEALLPLPRYGLSSDGIHPSIRDYNTGCQFDEQGLAYGYNTRNLVMLEGLERAMRVVVDAESSLDGPGETLRGQGTETAPYVISSLPFSDLRDVSSATTATSADCSDAGTGSRKQQIYRLSVGEPTRVRAAVMQASAPAEPDGGTPSLGLQLNLLRDGACVRSGAKPLALNLSPGAYTFSVEHDGAASGEYVFIVVPCTAGDAQCAQLAGP